MEETKIPTMIFEDDLVADRWKLGKWRAHGTDLLPSDEENLNIEIGKNHSYYKLEQVKLKCPYCGDDIPSLLLQEHFSKHQVFHAPESNNKGYSWRQAWQCPVCEEILECFVAGDIEWEQRRSIIDDYHKSIDEHAKKHNLNMLGCCSYKGHEYYSIDNDNDDGISDVICKLCNKVIVGGVWEMCELDSEHHSNWKFVITKRMDGGCIFVESMNHRNEFERIMDKHYNEEHHYAEGILERTGVKGEEVMKSEAFYCSECNQRFDITEEMDDLESIFREHVELAHDIDLPVSDIQQRLIDGFKSGK